MTCSHFANTIQRKDQSCTRRRPSTESHLQVYLADVGVSIMTACAMRNHCICMCMRFWLRASGTPAFRWSCQVVLDHAWWWGHRRQAAQQHQTVRAKRWQHQAVELAAEGATWSLLAHLRGNPHFHYPAGQWSHLLVLLMPPFCCSGQTNAWRLLICLSKMCMICLLEMNA